jgi:cytochrome bd-type quinol oxidase subunit 2
MSQNNQIKLAALLLFPQLLYVVVFSFAFINSRLTNTERFYHVEMVTFPILAIVFLLYLFTVLLVYKKKKWGYRLGVFLAFGSLIALFAEPSLEHLLTVVAGLLLIKNRKTFSSK